jgi:hypothetical protein
MSPLATTKGTALMNSGATGGVGGYVYGATSTLFVGGIAAAAAFGLVKVLDPNAA